MKKLDTSGQTLAEQNTHRGSMPAGKAFSGFREGVVMIPLLYIVSPFFLWDITILNPDTDSSDIITFSQQPGNRILDHQNVTSVDQSCLDTATLGLQVHKTGFSTANGPPRPSSTRDGTRRIACKIRQE